MSALLLAAVTVHSSLSVLPAANSDLTIILERLYSADGPPSACTGDAAKAVCAAAAKEASAMRSDGSWPDLKYRKPIANNQLPVDHWGRLTDMGRAVHCSGCSTTNRTDMQAKISTGISYWKANNFLDPNWWQNDFGAPMEIEKLLVTMANSTTGPPLSAADAAYCVSLLERGSDPMWHPIPTKPYHYTGENLVWSLQIDINRGALTGNTTLIRTAFQKMWASMVISPQEGDGLMADGSFHQHGPLLQSGSYGNGLMTDILDFVLLSAGTSFVIPDDALKVFTHYLTAGESNMLRAGLGVDVPTWHVPPRGREITRRGNGPFPAEAVAGGIDALLKLPIESPTKAELLAFQAQLRGQQPPASRTRHFPDSDYTTHLRPAFSQDVRTWSKRTYNSECVNAENQLGAHLADGAAYTMVSGTEYFEIFPVWDWRKVPGVLARQEHQVAPACHYERLGATEFVGGLEINATGGGVVAMDFAHGPPQTCQDFDGVGDGSICCLKSCGHCGGTDCGSIPGGPAGCCTSIIEKSNRTCSASVSAPCKIAQATSLASGLHMADDISNTLTAKRAWFLLDEGFLSLSAGIELGAADSSVAVSIEQSLLNGSVSSVSYQCTGGCLTKAGDPTRSGQEKLIEGNQSYPLSSSEKSVWLVHHNITYVALGTSTTGAVLRASAGTQTGSWHQIATETGYSPASKGVFKAWIDLGPAPMANASAAYAVLPGMTADRVVGFMKRVNVLANNPDRQVVDVTDDRGVRSIMAVVYTGDVVLTAAESGGISIQTDTPLLLSVTLGDKQVGLSFSRPSTVASSTTLTVNGLPVGLKTDAGSAATCDSEGFIKLQFPSAQGRSAIGSCSV